MLIYISTTVVNLVLLANTLHPDDQWVYNLYMPVEAGLLSWAAFEYFKTNKRRFLIWVGYLIFLIAFVVEVSIKGIQIFSNHGYIAESALLLIIYLLLLYDYFTKQNTNWKSSPDVWISLGIVLYFGGVVPYLSLMQYLQSSHPKINLFLFYFIIEGLANVRYLLLALGFWFVRRNVLSKISGFNE